jgi:phosphoserine phosphatase
MSKNRKAGANYLSGSAGISDLVKALQARSTAVALVSGGFRQIIEPIADSLDIPRGHVHANKLLFAEDGSYAGFDSEEYTSRSGGKAEACRALKKENGYCRVVMVGDGATDLEARQEGGADIFICYGGVVYRDTVAQQADWVVMRVQTLIDALS